MVVSDNTHLGAGLVLLPWETMDDSKSILCDPLMEKILGLSIAEVALPDIIYILKNFSKHLNEFIYLRAISPHLRSRMLSV